MESQFGLVNGEESSRPEVKSSRMHFVKVFGLAAALIFSLAAYNILIDGGVDGIGLLSYIAVQLMGVPLMVIVSELYFKHGDGLLRESTKYLMIHIPCFVASVVVGIVIWKVTNAEPEFILPACILLGFVGGTILSAYLNYFFILKVKYNDIKDALKQLETGDVQTWIKLRKNINSIFEPRTTIIAMTILTVVLAAVTICLIHFSGRTSRIWGVLFIAAGVIAFLIGPAYLTYFAKTELFESDGRLPVKLITFALYNPIILKIGIDINFGLLLSILTAMGVLAPFLI